MIEINGEITPNAFDHFDEHIKGKKEVIFVRTDTKPLKVYENWKDKKEGYGPSGSSVSIGEKHTIAIPMEFYTLKTFGGDAKPEQVHVRYYVTKTPMVLPGGVQGTNYDAGQGCAAYLFEGDSIKINIKTAQGLELYRVLMAHPSNEEHPAKGPKKPALFRLLRPEQSSKAANERMQLINKCIAAIYNEKDMGKTDLVKIHKHISAANPGIGWMDTVELADADDYDTIKSNLAAYANANPKEAFDLLNMANVGLVNLITECEKAGVVVYNDTLRRWFWSANVKRNIPEICDVGVGQDKKDALMAHLIYDDKGKKVHEIMKSELEKTKSSSGG